MTAIRIEVDTAVHAAYITLSDAEVARTVEVNEHILVDLDEFGVAVGVEVLDEAAALPFAELLNDFHVHSDVVDLLRLIRPNVDSFLQFHQGVEGAASQRAVTDLQPA